jgi:hypothetical protein
VRRAVEGDRLVPGRTNLEQNHAAIGVLDGMHLEPRVRPQAGGEPRQQVLVPLGLGRVGIEASADDGVRRVVDAEQQVSARLSCQARGVGQSG